MADIVIRGMAMPKDGRKHTALLQFLEDGKCRGIVEYSKSYRWCKNEEGGTENAP